MINELLPLSIYCPLVCVFERVASLFSQDCIPEYSVCHVDKLDRIESFIANNGLALSCVGASYRGVSVNDCIYHSRLAAEGLLSALPARSDGVTV